MGQIQRPGEQAMHVPWIALIGGLPHACLPTFFPVVLPLAAVQSEQSCLIEAVLQFSREGSFVYALIRAFKKKVFRIE